MKRSTKIGWGLVAGLLLVLTGLMAFGVYRLQRDRSENLALKKAGGALDQDDLDGAIALFDQALRLHLPPSKASTAYYGRANVENRKFKYDDAIRDFSEAIRLDPAGVNAYWGRGFAYQSKGELDKALSDYAEVVRRDRNAARVCFNRGLIYLQRKEWAKAVQDFSETIRCEPGDGYAYLERGSALAELNDLDGALASLDASISINPLAEAYNVRAAVYKRRGDIDRARNDELKATQLASNQGRRLPFVPMFDPTPLATDLLGRARIALVAGRYDEAIDLCSEALGKNMNSWRASNVFMTRGNAYAGKDDWDRALRDYEEAITIEPKNADAWTNRGNAYAHKKQRDKSTHDYDEAIRLNPNLAEAYCNRALNYLDSGNTDKALADLTEAIRINPKFAEAYSRRAMVSMRLKRADKAMADAETAVTLRPESGEVYLFRGRLHEARREFAEARSDFERELQLDREPRPASLNGAAWFYATCPDNTVRDGKRAVELAKKACDLTQWKDTHILDTLAAAYAETGDFSEAVKWQTQALDSPDEPADIRSGMQQRLRLYEKHQPYRQELKP